MSLPFGAPQQVPQQPGTPPDGARDVRSKLLLAAAGLGVLAYFLGLFAGNGFPLDGVAGFGVVTAGVLAAIGCLPKMPNVVIAATPLSVYGALTLAAEMIKTGVSALPLLLALAAILQAVALVVILLRDAGKLGEKGETPVVKPVHHGPPQPPYGQAPPAPFAPASAGFAPGPYAPANPQQGNQQAPSGGPALRPPFGQPGSQSPGVQSQSGQIFGPTSHAPGHGSGSGQAYGNRPPHPGGFPSPSQPASGQASAQQRSAESEQPAQSSQSSASDEQASDSGSPQGTMQMPHPGASSNQA